MPRPAPQTDRVVAVIELLAEAEEGASMTEIAGALAVNQATCVHLLAALTTAGFLVREPSDRRYHLGPALVRPGRRAAERYPALAAARGEMAALSKRFGLPCFAFAPEGDHGRLVHYTWPPGGAPPEVKLGERVPLRPPLGMAFAAWGPDDVFQAWLALEPDLGPEQAARYEQRRTAVRDLGFVAELAPDPANRGGLVDALVDPSSPYRDGQLHRLLSSHDGQDHVLTDLADAGPRTVIGVSAPAFDGGGGLVLILDLVTYPEVLDTPAISEIGAAVRVAADAVTTVLCR
ncbi:hypothetical protein BH10ACT1_BH10ACT1_12740 [soil metagenome]